MLLLIILHQVLLRQWHPALQINHTCLGLVIAFLVVIVVIRDDNILLWLPLLQVQYKARAHLMLIHPISNILFRDAHKTAAQEVARFVQHLILLSEYV